MCVPAQLLDAPGWQERGCPAPVPRVLLPGPVCSTSTAIQASHSPVLLPPPVPSRCHPLSRQTCPSSGVWRTSATSLLIKVQEDASCWERGVKACSSHPRRRAPSSPFCGRAAPAALGEGRLPLPWLPPASSQAGEGPGPGEATCHPGSERDPVLTPR